MICYKPWTDFYISNALGAVKVCCWNDIIIGNINSNSLVEIWNSPVISNLRHRFNQGRFNGCSYLCPLLNGFENIEPYWNSFKNKPSNRNAALNQKEIERKYTKLRSRPRFYKLFIDSKCNLDCRFCHLSSKGEILRSKYQDDILIENAELMESLRIWGGEPLYSNRTIKVLKTVCELNNSVKVDLITNGHYLEVLLSQQLAKLNFGFIIISLDAANAVTYKKIRRSSSFDELIRKIVYVKKELGDSFDFFVLDMVIQPDNLHEIVDFIRLGAKINIDVKFSILDGCMKWATNKSFLKKEIFQGIKVAHQINMRCAHESLRLLHSHA